MNKCKQCNINTDLFFCPNCGQILKYPNFIKDNEKLEKSISSFVKSLVSEAKAKKIKIAEKVDKGILSDAVFRKYFEHVAWLKDICDSDATYKTFDTNAESLIDTMISFGEKCISNECQIAIVGTVKAGKSMFLNAILGREIASTYPTPETASVTKFRYSTKGDYVKVSFYKKTEWEQLWASVMEAKENSYRDDKEDFLSEYTRLNADSIKSQFLDKKDEVYKIEDFETLKSIVTKYTSCKYAEHFFAKEVEVGLTSFNVPKNVVFVDTPGLNDPVSFRSDITKRYLHSANVVLLCVKAASSDITASELEDIAILFQEMRHSKERIYLFGTQYDNANTHFVRHWEKYTKPEFMKYLSGSRYFNSEKVASERIMPVSAWYYNMIQRAKNNRSIWENSDDVDILAELLTRCLGRSVVEEYTDKYGSKEGRPMCFYNHISELETQTNIPIVSRIIMDGPIKDAESIIKQDVRDVYVSICEHISEVANDAIALKEEAIELSSRADVVARIHDLEKQIQHKESTLTENISKINALIDDIGERTDDIINRLKSK